MKIKYTNFRRVINVGALSDAGENLVVLILFTALFAGLAYYFRDKLPLLLFFLFLAGACCYALVMEIRGLFFKE